jgi:hypothetical protein
MNRIKIEDGELFVFRRNKLLKVLDIILYLPNYDGKFGIKGVAFEYKNLEIGVIYLTKAEKLILLKWLEIQLENE